MLLHTNFQKLLRRNIYINLFTYIKTVFYANFCLLLDYAVSLLLNIACQSNCLYLELLQTLSINLSMKLRTTRFIGVFVHMYMCAQIPQQLNSLTHNYGLHIKSNYIHQPPSTIYKAFNYISYTRFHQPALIIRFAKY